MSGGLTFLDRPNSYIGRSVPRPNARRLLEGRGTFVDDVAVPRLAHVAFLRSPVAHARIAALHTAAASAMPGVLAVVDGPALARVCAPWVGVLGHFKGLRSAPQHALAVDRVTWVGEPFCAVVARSRPEAEDALAAIRADLEPLPAVVDMETALDPGTPPIHPELGDNLAFERRLEVGDVEGAFRDAALVVEETFGFGRHTGVCLEPRAILADWNAADGLLTVHHSFQAPHMMQDILAKHLALPEGAVRVICRDVGGSFGIKVHIYPDEMATCALALMLRRPVKFVADRLESFTSDIHARDHRVTARMAFSAEGDILALDMDDLTGIGPYSVYPRTSAVEANQVVNLTGGPYRHGAYRARARVVLQNKAPTCQYRAVGHPIATMVAEGLLDLGAARLGLDPAAIRLRNVIPDDAYPCAGVSGIRLEKLSHQAALAKLLAMMDYDALRAEQAALRREGVHRGIGLSVFIEITNPSAAFYGVGGARISAQDGCTIRLDPQGGVVAAISVTEQGQGTEAVIAQVVATATGVPLGMVRVVSGDTQATPYGGGTWASRGAGIGGEAAWQAGKALRANVTAVAAAILQARAETLDIREGAIVDAATGVERMSLAELGRIAYFRPDTLPAGVQPEFVVTRHYVPKDYPFAFTNGVQASSVEVDVETGFVRLLGHWCVEDCGTVLNPLLVDEQIRGGIVQGLGGALFEHCLYDSEGQLLNGSMADYLVPMAGEMPDIAVAHVVSATASSEIGAKGAGEAGTAGAPAAVVNAINDALRPLGARVSRQPVTPETILEALGAI
ncbi:Caffeine dehydrogenase subunit alpha [Methylobacterium crusticola]|uniref:Caffeine dehydrogenase subunit alpha n=1 Tax=Methylobacterium crusticola TaxID=1697972 RepID=A0ABQ4QQW5_9HYPH|nr:xanthine dehydrogenase family protein molybdopterin-binding subunit [Methylobacterium crusticola]GJD47300.1 Caffeine dehydrogenase subunit alpha [Methylobacterium crusticola]